MKMKLWLLLFILFLPVVFSAVECSQVFVVNFNYDNGVVSYKDKVIKCGYAPDRNMQPGGCYKAEMLSMDNDELYSFRFCIPLEINVDLVDPIIKSMSGGMVVLNETDFALIFPYYDDAKSIVVYNSRDYEVLQVPLIEEQFIQKKSFWWIILLIILLIVLYLSYRYFERLRNKPIDSGYVQGR